MSDNRWGALSAGLFTAGWLVAVAVNVGVWLPQIGRLPPDFWDDGRLFLEFVRDNAVSWRVFHVGATGGLLALLFLIPLLSALAADSGRKWAFTAVAEVGAFCALLASLVDHFATPVLARFAQGGAPMPIIIWQAMEPWRDAGLKTVSYWLLGIWAVWLAGVLLREVNGRFIGRFTQIVGVALLLLALIETMTPPPLLYTLGETGVGAVAILLLPLWGLALTRWFWQRAVAEI